MQRAVGVRSVDGNVGLQVVENAGGGLEDVAVHIGGDEDDPEFEIVAPVALEIVGGVGLQRFGQDTVAHRVSDNVYALDLRLVGDDIEELLEIRRRAERAVLVTAIVRERHFPGRRPAEQDRHADIKDAAAREIHRQLGRADERVIERRVEAVHEQQHGI